MVHLFCRIGAEIFSFELGNKQHWAIQEDAQVRIFNERGDLVSGYTGAAKVIVEQICGARMVRELDHHDITPRRDSRS
jgi:hypothetical protein